MMLKRLWRLSGAGAGPHHLTADSRVPREEEEGDDGDEQSKEPADLPLLGAGL